MLKLVKRPKSPFIQIRSTTLQGVRIEESTGVSDWKIAEEIRIRRESELLTAHVRGPQEAVTFAHAVASYIEHGDGELYTGGRTGEAVWLNWSALDLDRAQVRFVKTKNGEARSVRCILASWRR